MTKLIGILSGKGGVGKTTLAINLTTALSLLGQDSVLIDADLTKANVSVHLGAYRCTTTLHEVLWQQKSIQDALYLHPSGLRFVPAGISLYHAKNTTPELIKGLPAHTKGIATSVILDGPLGASGQLPAFLSILDELIVVTTPDLPSLSDTMRVLQEAQQHPVAIKGVVVNRAHFNAFEIDQESIAELLKDLGANSKIKNVKFVTKEDALEIYKKATSDNPLLSELLSPDIFPASIEFSVTDLAYARTIVNEVKLNGSVESVGITASLGGESTLGDVVDQLKTITANVRIGGMIIVSVLLATSFVVLFVVIGMRVSMRKEEVEILKLIGATPSFVRLPVLFEAVFYAIGGVFIGWLVACVVLMYVSPYVVNYFQDIPILPSDPKYFFGLLGALLAAETLFGIFIAFVSGFLALTRVSKGK